MPSAARASVSPTRHSLKRPRLQFPEVRLHSGSRDWFSRRTAGVVLIQIRSGERDNGRSDSGNQLTANALEASEEILRLCSTWVPRS